MTTTRRRSRYAVTPDFPRALPAVEPRYTPRSIPSPGVVICGSALFVYALGASIAGYVVYRIAESLTGRNL